VSDSPDIDRGHVFVARADLKRIACDAWLVSGGHGPGKTWRPALPPRDLWLPLPDRWAEDDGPRTMLLADVDDAEALPFLTDITGNNRRGPAWFVDGARAFVRAASSELRARKRAPLNARKKHLLTLPLLGTGGGGGGHLSGEVVRLLLKALREEARAHDVDVALVLFDGPAWAAAQKERNDAGDEPWRALSPELAQAADDLAHKAKNGDLVLFLGAGVSRAAGLPSWTGLLEDLAVVRAHIENDVERDALSKLGELDRAAIIKRRLHDEVPLGVAVAQLLRQRAKRYALGHALLSSLPVEEAITTNYDDLFEMASADVDRPCTVLPGGEVARGRRWILKMHGSVSRPETIVLTREDYMKFQENRTALAGIVQALLLTRHMLFVGFSFTDDNFHRIAHAVRNSLGGERAKFGTTLVVASNPLAEELWGDDLDWIAFSGDTAAQARTLDIFLDRLAAKAAAATSHLGDRRYDGVLSAGERTLRDRLMSLRDASADERETGAWAEVERMLRRLGMG
jgi:hypothetical protein